jgi:hypothetical protein
VRVFLAALATGKSVREAAKLATLTERQIERWVAFHNFLPAVRGAQRKGKLANEDPFGDGQLDALIELNAALADRSERQRADRYAGGDRERLHQMWISGELDRIWVAEAAEQHPEFIAWHFSGRPRSGLAEVKRAGEATRVSRKISRY